MTIDKQIKSSISENSRECHPKDQYVNNTSRSTFSSQAWKGVDDDRYDLDFNIAIDEIYDDIQNLNRVDKLTQLKFHDILLFNRPNIALEQVVNSYVKGKEGLTIDDLHFAGLGLSNIFKLLHTFHSKSVSEIIEKYLSIFQEKTSTFTCGKMREIANRLPFNLELYLTSRFAALSNDPYIVFTLRLMGIYDLDTFLGMMEGRKNSACFRTVVNDFVNTHSAVVKTLTVNKYLKILLALPDKSVHLKKVLFQPGGIFYNEQGNRCVERYADFEVLGVSSVLDLIRILLPVSGRKQNLFSYLKNWFKEKRRQCTHRTCSEQRHIWAGLLIPEDPTKICEESVHPYFLYKGGVLYHTKNRELKQINGKILNYLGAGLLPYWDTRLQVEESKKPDITVIEVMRKFYEEHRRIIKGYLSITKDTVFQLLNQQRSGEEELEKKLRALYEARPDIFFDVFGELRVQDPELLRSLLHVIPDIVVMYLNKTEYHLLNTLPMQKVAKILMAVPWAWSAFSEGILDGFMRKKWEFGRSDNVLVNPLTWSTIAESIPNESLVSRIFDQSLIKRICNELTTEQKDSFRDFINRMIMKEKELTSKVHRLLELGPAVWMMFIDPKHHKYGPYVFDEGFHGGLVEKGYLEGMYAGLIWCAYRLSREETPGEEFVAYRILNQIVYSHNYRKVGGELRTDAVMRHNNTKVSQNTIKMEIEGISEWDEAVAYPVVPTKEIKNMMTDEGDTADRFSIQFKEALNIKKYLEENIYVPYNASIHSNGKRQNIILQTAIKHKRKELLHVFRDGVSRSNWLELNLDLVRHGQSIVIIEPNDSYTYPKKMWAKKISDSTVYNRS